MIAASLTDAFFILAHSSYDGHDENCPVCANVVKFLLTGFMKPVVSIYTIFPPILAAMCLSGSSGDIKHRTLITVKTRLND
jgi:hypothetical protein